jgi:hypothetical protein
MCTTDINRNQIKTPTCRTIYRPELIGIATIKKCQINGRRVGIRWADVKCSTSLSSAVPESYELASKPAVRRYSASLESLTALKSSVENDEFCKRHYRAPSVAWAFDPNKQTAIEKSVIDREANAILSDCLSSKVFDG